MQTNCLDFSIAIPRMPAMLRSRTIAILAAAILSLCAVATRCWRLERNPLWYTDEADFIGFSAQLGAGFPLAEARHKALIFPLATNALPHPPLFFWLHGQAIRLMGRGILAGRALSALTALVSTALLYFAVRRLWGQLAAALAAGLFCFHWPSVFFLRWGMPYNVAMGWEIAAFWALARGTRGVAKEFWNTLGAGFAGAAAASAFFAIPFAAFAAGLAIWRLRRKPLAWLAIAALAALPLGGFMAIGWAARGEAFWRDFQGLAMRGSGGAEGIREAFAALAMQIRLMATRDGVYIAGLAGLAWTAWQGKRRRWTVLAFLLLAAPPLLKRGRDIEIKYDAPMYLFWLHAGAGALAAQGRRAWLRRAKTVQGRRRLHAAAWLAACGLLAGMAGIRLHEVATRLPSRYEAVGSVLDIDDAYALAAWINARTDDSDLIVAPDRVHFLIRGRVTSIYQSVAYVCGSTTWHENIEPWRFAFPCDYRQARFIVIDHTDRAIVIHPANPNMNFLADELNSGRWAVALELGEYWALERK